MVLSDSFSVLVTMERTVPVGRPEGMAQLYPGMKRSIAILYGPAPQHQGQPAPGRYENDQIRATAGDGVSWTQSLAHDFLFKIRARNPQRAFKSLQGRKKNSRGDSSSMNNRGGGGGGGHRSSPSSPCLPSVDTLVSEFVGSSWAACLAILFHPDSTSSERIFCAQTLAYRVSKFDIHEAIDLSFEVLQRDSFTGDVSTDGWPEVPLPSPVEQSLLWLQFLGIPSAPIEGLFGKDEHVSLGIVTMYLLAVCSVRLASMSLQGAGDHPTDVPLLSAIGRTISVLAVRMRYSSRHLRRTGSAATATPMLLEIQTAFHRTLLHSALGDAHPERLAMLCYWTTVASLPRVVLVSDPRGSPGSLSIDLQCIAAARTEVREVSTGFALVADSWNRQSTKGLPECLLYLEVCTAWAHHVSLPMAPLQDAIALSIEVVPEGTRLGGPNTTKAIRASLRFWDAVLERGNQFIDGFPTGSRTGQTQRQDKQQDFPTDPEHERRIAVESGRLLSGSIWPGLQDLLSMGNSLNIDGVNVFFTFCSTICACVQAQVSFGKAMDDARLKQDVVDMMVVFREMCSDSSSEIRSLCIEPLESIHAILSTSAENIHGTEVGSFLSDVLADVSVSYANSLPHLCCSNSVAW